MGKMALRIRNRVTGPATVLLAEDIKSLFSRGKMTTLGATWFFRGEKAYQRAFSNQFYRKYFDANVKCLIFNEVKFPTSVDEYRGPFVSEVCEIFSNDLDRRFDYPDYALKKIFAPYEFREITIDTGDIVIDAGANIGVFSALAAKKIRQNTMRGGGCVYAFEPTPDARTVLEKTVALNVGITIVPLALSDTTGYADIFLDEIDTWSSTLISSRVMNAGAKTIQIQTTTLDQFANDNNLTKIDFIKADIEGAERLMLKGAKEVLKDFAPKLAMCNYHLPDDPQVMRELILSANEKYVIYENWRKMYAYVPK